MAWLAIDFDFTEKVFRNEPSLEDGRTWIGNHGEEPIYLPYGTIEKILGHAIGNETIQI